MRQYLTLLQKIKDKGVKKGDRTGTGTISLFGEQLKFNLSDGFPLVTTKKVFLKGIIYELLWFIKGDTNIKYLNDNNIHIWDAWADEKGDLGPVYGKQWRNFGGVDQLADVIDRIKTNPNDRRIIMTAWNPPELSDMKLPPCLCFYQFYVVNGKLSMQMYQRSADVFLGVPFDIASSTLLLMMVAQVTGLKLGTFVHTFGDVHIYKNHLKQVDIQLFRTSKKLPIMKLNPDIKDIFNFKYEDFTLEEYDYHPRIKAPIAV